jgi:hypothetical protein
VQVNVNGTIEGIPASIVDFKGVPAPVSENTTSKFAIRATDIDNRISDRTFTLTVSGQDKPEFKTPAGRIGQFFDGGKAEFQFEMTDADPTDSVTIELVSGKLPPGITVNTSGLLYGFISATPVLAGEAVAGWDRDSASYDEYPFDFSTRSISQNYEFTLQVNDGKDVTLRTFSMFVYSRSSMTADSIEFTVDSDFITADSIAVRSPYMTNYVYNIGRYRHENFFAYQLQGTDPDGDKVEYILHPGDELPPTLTLDINTGWISGYLQGVGLTEQNYAFSIQVQKANEPGIVSKLYPMSITVIGEIETSVSWITPSFVGTIDNGSISTLSVKAVHQVSALSYRFSPGKYNKLPQGLTLNPSGNIVGRTSFKTFSLDSGRTTFDSDHATRLSVKPTTFDLTFRFTAEAYSSDGFVSVTKEFTILVNRVFDSPHNTLYCKAMPPLADRELLNTMMLNQDVLPPSILYRADDVNFGAANNIVYAHAFGLTPATVESYFAATDLNHYNKRVTLGELKTARALDENDKVVYEVVYCTVVDDLTNRSGESVPRSVTNHVPVTGTTSTVYPNSLDNMRDHVIDQIGQQSKVLPRWMLSKQENGEVLGFTAAWVLAYTKPGKSSLLKYNVTEFFGNQLNLIDFEIDRYTLDYRMSRDWSIDIQKWATAVLTTFDRLQITADTTQVTADEMRYTIDAFVQATIPDTNIGFDHWLAGFDIDAFDIDYEPTPPRFLSPYAVPTETIFDGGSCRFTEPVDKYEQTDRYDRYIKFPKFNIIGNE